MNSTACTLFSAISGMRSTARTTRVNVSLTSWTAATTAQTQYEDCHKDRSVHQTVQNVRQDLQNRSFPRIVIYNQLNPTIAMPDSRTFTVQCIPPRSEETIFARFDLVDLKRFKQSGYTSACTRHEYFENSIRTRLARPASLSLIERIVRIIDIPRESFSSNVR